MSSSRAKEGLRIGARGGGDEAPLPLLSIPPPSSPLLLAQLLSMFVLSMCASSDTRVFAGLRSQLCFLLVFPPASEHSSSTSSPLLAFAHASDFYDLSACVSSDF